MKPRAYVKKVKAKAPNPHHYLSPAGIAWEGSEDAHQAAIFAWAARAARIGCEPATDQGRYVGLDLALQAALDASMWAEPALKWLHAIPNGGARDKVTASLLKATGVRRGIADMFLPVARGGFHGLYVELKVGGGTASNEQIEFATHCHENGYAWRLCYGWESAVEDISYYLSL